MTDTAQAQYTPLGTKFTTVRDTVLPFKGLIYGAPGTTKTTLCAGMPNPLIVDTERGVRSLKNHPALWDIPTFKVTSYTELFQLFHELNAGYYPELETIVIDTMTELQRRHLDELLGNLHATNSSINPFLPTGKNYQENTETIRRIVTMFRDLDRNLILTAHEVEVTNDDNGRVELIRPFLSPKLLGTIYGVMDFIAYIKEDLDETTGTSTYFMQVKNSKMIRAKSRLLFPAPVLINPTAKDIVDANLATPPDLRSALDTEILDPSEGAKVGEYTSEGNTQEAMA